MNVDAILKSKGREVLTTPATTTVASAIEQFASSNIGALVVSSDGDRVEGIVSERDVVRALARHGVTLLSMPVGRIMSTARVCSPSDTLGHVMEVMTVSRHRHLPVVGGGRLRGIISIGDVVKARLHELTLEVNVLRDAYIARH